MKLNDVNYEQLSPMMKQYYDIKKNYEGILLFYRLGDFYELFFEDAEVASRNLGLTLTGKNAGLEERVPMCGAPHHSIKTYIQEALAKGFKVAICEQMEDPKQAKGTVRREVTEVISKGSIADFEFLDNKDMNYLGSILVYPSTYVITYADISTGELNSITIDKNENKLLNIILNNNFKEVLLMTDTDLKLIDTLTKIYHIDITKYDELYEEPLSFVNNLDIKTVKGIRHILYYLCVKELKNIDHFSKVNLIDDDEYLYMDIHAIRNLELTETLRLKEKTNSLIWLIDKCKTSMGSRKLKSWLLKPLRNRKKIENRYDKIQKLNDQFLLRSELETALYEIYDIERLCGKISCGNANAKDLLQLKNSLSVIPSIKRIIEELAFDYKINTFKELYDLIESAIDEDAPISIKEGHLIKKDYNTELDELRLLRSSGKDFISKIEAQAKQLTGITSLKVGYNKIFGYFIEVTNAHKDKIKDEYGWIRKQTLVGSERYISPELKEKENLILNAEEKIVELEYKIFIEIRDKVREEVHSLIELSQTISEIDALTSLSIISENLNFTRPKICEDQNINIIKGRHPVVEHVSDKEYVPNDIKMNANINTLLITGPNMSGKSTYMRELAIIIILAQMGSFVPAESCEIPLFDKIFTRIGASDDLVSGESTFMVEMKEANEAITSATKNSLILFDELGRGTATYDGMSIAEAILKYVNEQIKCKTLFSTHYHELTELANTHPTIKNVHVSAKEENNKVYFLHKIEDGPVDKSYGIHVAKLSGMPDAVIKMATTILAKHENKVDKTEYTVDQLEFNFEAPPTNSELTNYLDSLDPNSMTPKEALDAIYVMKEIK